MLPVRRHDLKITTSPPLPPTAWVWLTSRAGTAATLLHASQLTAALGTQRCSNDDLQKPNTRMGPLTEVSLLEVMIIRLSNIILVEQKTSRQEHTTINNAIYARSSMHTLFSPPPPSPAHTCCTMFVCSP